MRPSLIALTAASLSFVTFTASAVTLDAGLYQLGNHPDGNAVPPPYGMKLDELVNVTGGHDTFTMNFEHASSNMTLVYDDVGETITISGLTYGGRDIGGVYAADAYQGIYTVSFLYDVNVSQTPGDDDIWVTANQQNFGTITLPDGSTVKDLGDIGMGGYSFRLGDEDNDLGHRGFAGISGWGWMSVDGVHVADQDWLFTATYVPEPATCTMLLAGGAFAMVRRRR
jgi:hypothetical protein